MLLQEFINYQVASILLEIRGTFKWPEFKNLQTLDQQFQYAQNNLQELGRGSSRAAFLLSNRYVLKIALPAAAAKGISQNNGELQVFAHEASKDLVTAIHDYDKNGYWIVTELARPLSTPEEFKALTGIDWDEFVSINSKSNWENVNEEIVEITNGIKIWSRRLQTAQQEKNEENIQKYTKNVEKLKRKLSSLNATINNPFLLKVRNLHKSAGVVGGDILELGHWGKTTDGRLVLIDYGFTKDLIHLYGKTAA